MHYYSLDNFNIQGHRVYNTKYVLYTKYFVSTTLNTSLEYPWNSQGGGQSKYSLIKERHKVIIFSSMVEKVRFSNNWFICRRSSTDEIPLHIFLWARFCIFLIHLLGLCIESSSYNSNHSHNCLIYAFCYDPTAIFWLAYLVIFLSTIEGIRQILFNKAYFYGDKYVYGKRKYF